MMDSHAGNETTASLLYLTVFSAFILISHDPHFSPVNILPFISLSIILEHISAYFYVLI